MALTKELLNVLDNNSEPFAKRLKLADNAFKSLELPIQHREAVLLQWLSSRAVTDNSDETWSLLLKWLKSQQLQDISKNDINKDDVSALLKAIGKRKRKLEKSTETIVADCVTALIENRNFHIFFKHNLEAYCKFLRNVIDNINYETRLINLITHDQLFNKTVIAGDNFCLYFIEVIVPALADSVERFASDGLFQECSKVVQKCLFKRNFKTFQAFFDEIFAVEEEIPSNELMSHLQENMTSRTTTVTKLIFHSYCTSYANHSELIFKFFILHLQMLGFNMKDYLQATKLEMYENSHVELSDSVCVITELCRVLTQHQMQNVKANDRTFPDVLENLSLLVLTSMKPSKASYEFLDCVATLDPLLIEKLIDELLVYLLSSEDQGAEYEKFFVSVFKIYAKLHRISNLISKLFPTIKAPLDGSVVFKHSAVHFHSSDSTYALGEKYVLSNPLPASVLECFGQCITSLASWQVMNIFKTFLYHLQAAIESDLAADAATDKSRTVYIEVISGLLCQFLLSVRMAEHTVPANVLEKFVASMEQLKEVLKNFGTTLVKMEHNPPLMKTYLNICYIWGEQYVALVYYSTNQEVSLQKNLDNDMSACNITYLHSYLSRDQWCLFSQRITNFGEQPCKLIMYKLFVQKVRAMLLFEETVPKEIFASLQTALLPGLSDNWREIAFDQVVLSHVISQAPKLKAVSEAVLLATLADDCPAMDALLESADVCGALLFRCLCKINRAMRSDDGVTFHSRKIFKLLNEATFRKKEANLSEIRRQLFAQVENVEQVRRKVAIDEDEICKYLRVIEKFPLVQSRNLTAVEVLLIYFTSLILDLKRVELQSERLKSLCEEIVIGLASHSPTATTFLTKDPQIVITIINNFTRYTDIVGILFTGASQTQKGLKNFRPVIDFLLENLHDERYINCLVPIMTKISKIKKSSLSEKRKALLLEYERDICENAMEFMRRQNSVNTEKDTEILALVLNYNIYKTEKENQKELASFIHDFIKEIFNSPSKNKNGVVTFFIRIVRGKITPEESKDDLLMNIWNFCQKNAQVMNQKDYTELVVLIFEHIPNKQFERIAEDLLNSTEEALKGDKDKTVELFKIWNAIVQCNFNQVKLYLWQRTLEKLLIVFLKSMKEGPLDICEEVINFETNVVANLHIPLTPVLMDALLVTVTVLTTFPFDFTRSFTLSILLMETLLKYRSPFVMDVLPSYLQRYRALLRYLCRRSNANLLVYSQEMAQLADCAHKLERLTKNLAAHKPHIKRIAPYIIADILAFYEEILLTPNVKLHLNNCLYELIRTCDQHAISFLMRVLSTGSREMFKVAYDNYKKYHKFSGKV